MLSVVNTLVLIMIFASQTQTYFLLLFIVKWEFILKSFFVHHLWEWSRCLVRQHSITGSQTTFSAFRLSPFSRCSASSQVGKCCEIFSVPFTEKEKKKKLAPSSFFYKKGICNFPFNSLLIFFFLSLQVIKVNKIN